MIFRRAASALLNFSIFVGCNRRGDRPERS